MPRSEGRAPAQPSPERAQSRRPARSEPAARASPPRGAEREGAPLALWGIVAAALAIRLWQIGHGLPDFLDEALPLRRALDMTNWASGRIDWNPHRFHYPSLTFYLHVELQQLVYAVGAAMGKFASFPDYVLHTWANPSLLALPGRGLSVAFDVWTVWSVGRIGERIRPGAGLLAAGLVAASATMILASRLIYTDTVMAAFAMAAIERLLVWRARGGRGTLLTAVVLLGLAVGSKYPAALLLVPFALAILLSERRRAWPLVLATCAGAFAVFLATTPYALLDFKQFAADFSFVGKLGAQGHLGNYQRSGFLFHVQNVVRDFGWAAPLLLAASLPLAVRAWRERPEPALLWAALLVLGLPIALARIEAERYLVPLIPFVALLAAWAALALADLLPAASRRVATAALAALIAVPALLGAIRAGGALEDATRVEARRWAEAHLGVNDLIVQEAYAVPLLERGRVDNVHHGRVWASAGAAARRAYDSRAAFRTVTLPLSVVGAKSVKVAVPRGVPIEVDVLRHPADINAPAYDPRLFAGVDVVVTSSSVRGRFAAEPALYPEANRFYALLDSAATLLATFEPHGEATGPGLKIYRLTPRTHAAIAALGPLPPLWWTSAILPSFRAKVEPLLGGAGQPELGAFDMPAPWVLALGGVFSDRFQLTATVLAGELLQLGRFEPALALARAVRVMVPDDAEATRITVEARAALRGAEAPGNSPQPSVPARR